MLRQFLAVIVTVAFVAPLTGLAVADHDSAAEEAESVKSEIRSTLGEIPGYLEAFPESGLPGAWAELRDFQMSSETSLSNREKELIGLAVAAQIPCDYCVYYHTRAARANGASDREVREAIAIAAVTRHWSTVLNGNQIALDDFRAETDRMLARAEQRSTSK